jgi:predicted RNA-binding protein associated with RNAse of E/G family
MHVNNHLSRGSTAAVRGLVFGRVWVVRSVIVEHDTADESAVLLLPGAQCAFPEWYIKKSNHGGANRSRWLEILEKRWNLQTVAWHTDRFLMVTSPGKYYSVYLVWNNATDRFVCYYVNFQLPYTRSRCGFDTFDLELDIVVEPNGRWHLKDETAYEEGIRTGVIQREWAAAIAKEKNAVITAIERGDYPFDHHWRDYSVDSAWKPPCLPSGWEQPE